jgi:hypothetical protein
MANLVLLQVRLECQLRISKSMVKEKILDKGLRQSLGKVYLPLPRWEASKPPLIRLQLLPI